MSEEELRHELERARATIGELQNELAQTNHGVTALTLELDQRTAELVSANSDLEAFTASASHDLRAPLRALSGFSQALIEEYSDKLDVDGQRYLNHIRNAAEEMGQLIEDLLQLCRVGPANLRRESLELGEMARAVMEGLQAEEPHREVTLAVAGRISAQGDRGLLHQVMENLLGNAWKFTNKRSHARIETGMCEADGETAYFVRDNGVGFDEAYAEDLFVPFKRLHSEAEFTGTGVGLATVQRIIHRHGGRLWAEAEVDKGATFFFTLPQE